MAWLFCRWCEAGQEQAGASSFNEDISAWDTSSVRWMRSMFLGQELFNRPLGGWRLENVENIASMFQGALAFDQDLGWCVDDDVDFDPHGQGYTFQGAFSGTQCESTSCGVKQGALEENGNCQSTSALGSDGATTRSAALAALVLGAALA